MSGATPELSLATAVDADDNADYLTLSLAASLRTVDALFNNVTGHSHTGAHQGGPIGTIPITAIPDGSITSIKIANGTIATIDLADGSVTNPKLAAGSVTGDKIYSGDLTLPAGLISNGTINVRGSASPALAFFDGTHYMQYAPAGQTSLLQWSHDFKATGYLEAGSFVKTPTVQLPDANDTVTSDGTNLILRSNGTLYFQKANGTNIAYITSSAGLNLASGDVNCQSISLLQGGNQVIYWRDSSHYLQYAPSGGLTVLRWTHTLEAGLSVSATGGPVYGLGAYVNTASSEKIKKLIATLDSPVCLRQVEAVRPVSFEYREPIPHWTEQRLGFIAEEVGDVIPPAGSPEGISTEALLSVLWGAVRELSAQVRALQGVSA